MKIFGKVIAVCMTSLLSLSANAQFVNTGETASETSEVTEQQEKIPPHYGRFTIGYDANMFGGNGSRAYNEDGDKGATLSGFAIQYIHGFRLAKNVPAYAEVGYRINVNFLSVTQIEDIDGHGEDLKAKLYKGTMAIPFNLTYRINAGGKTTIAPYTGFNLAFNLLGNMKFSYDGRYEKEVEDFYNIDLDKSFDPYSKDDMGKDAKWSVFQFGWQIGCSFNFDQFYMGVEYGIDLTSLAKKINTSNLIASMGVCF